MASERLNVPEEHLHEFGIVLLRGIRDSSSMNDELRSALYQWCKKYTPKSVASFNRCCVSKEKKAKKK